MGPKHTHDCTACKFITVIGEMDVYTCRGTIIARFSSDGPDYASTPIEIFVDMIKTNSRIGLLDGKIMKFRDYLASEYASDYHKAWLIALQVIEQS